MSDIRKEINKFSKENYVDKQIPPEEGNPVWTMLKWGYRLFKWSIFLALFTAFAMSSQCRGQVKEICQYMRICG